MLNLDQDIDGAERDYPYRPKPVFVPIPADRANKVIETFFDPSFRSRHSAEEPYWVGDVATKILGLDSTVTFEVFHNLVNGRTPDGKSDLFTRSDGSGPRAWYRRCTAPGSVSSVWALGSPVIQELISESHNDAVNSELICAERGVGGDPNLEPDEYLSSFLFACFPGRASRAQSPQLHTRVVWINAAFSRFQVTQPLSAEQRKFIEALSNDYDGYLYRNLRSQLGRFRVPNYNGAQPEIIGVPAELYAGYARACLDRGGPFEPVLRANGKASTREELLECWRRQAEDFGWGASEAAALIRCVRRERVCLEARRDGKSLTAEEYREERIKAMTDHLLWRQRARFHARKGVKPWQAGKVIKG